MDVHTFQINFPFYCLFTVFGYYSGEDIPGEAGQFKPDGKAV
jgi:hypothetical protein